MSPQAASAPPKRLVAGLLILATLILWVYYGYVVRPMAEAIGRLREELRRVRIQASAIEQAVAQVPQLTREEATLARDVAQVRDALPSEEELAAVIQFLSDVASQTNVKIQTIFPQRPEGPGTSSVMPPPRAASPLYQDIPIQIDAVAGFHQFGEFLSRAEQGPHPLRVRSLRVSSNPREPRRHYVKLVMVTYVTTGSRPTSGEASPASRPPG